MLIVKRVGALILFNLWIGFAVADPYSEGWGPPVGEAFPRFVVKNHQNVDATLDTVSGKRGALLFLNRSVVW